MCASRRLPLAPLPAQNEFLFQRREFYYLVHLTSMDLWTIRGRSSPRHGDQSRGRARDGGGRRGGEERKKHRPKSRPYTHHHNWHPRTAMNRPGAAKRRCDRSKFHTIPYFSPTLGCYHGRRVLPSLWMERARPQFHHMQNEQRKGEWHPSQGGLGPYMRTQHIVLNT